MGGGGGGGSRGGGTQSMKGNFWTFLPNFFGISPLLKLVYNFFFPEHITWSCNVTVDNVVIYTVMIIMKLYI